MRIAMIASQVPPAYGGAGQQALALSEYLARLGAKVDVLSANQLGAPSDEVTKGVRIRRMREPPILRNTESASAVARVIRSIWFCFWLIWRLTFTRYDVIHVHGSYWFTVASALAAKFRNTALVVKVTRLGEDDAVTVSAKRLGPIPLGWLYGYGISRADAVIALTDEIAGRNRERYPSVKVVEWPNGVDTEFFRSGSVTRLGTRMKYGIGEATFAVLFVGYLVPHKGVDLLVEAWSKFHPGKDAHLILAGPNSGFYRELETEVVEYARNASAVTITGKVDRTEIRDLYSASDLFVLPTHAEGMPNSLLEALASGLPSITTRVPGPLEIGKVSSGILWMQEITADSLLSQLEIAYQRRGEADFVGAVDESVTLEFVAQEYFKLYQSLLEHRTRVPSSWT